MQGSTAAATNACMREKLQASAYGSFVGFKPFLSIGLGWVGLQTHFPLVFLLKNALSAVGVMPTMDGGRHMLPAMPLPFYGVLSKTCPAIPPWWCHGRYLI